MLRTSLTLALGVALGALSFGSLGSAPQPPQPCASADTLRARAFILESVDGTQTASLQSVDGSGYLALNGESPALYVSTASGSYSASLASGENLGAALTLRGPDGADVDLTNSPMLSPRAPLLWLGTDPETFDPVLEINARDGIVRY